MRRWTWVLASLVWTPATWGAISLGMVQGFQDGQLGGWGGGSGPTVVSTDGPGGAGDRYLRISSSGFKLGTRNESLWTGDYLAAGVNAIGLDLRNSGPELVSLRLMISGPGGDFKNTQALLLAPDNQWHSHLIELSSSALSHVGGGTGALEDTLGAVFRVLLHHQVGSPQGAGSGDNISATLGIDNISARALPIPEPGCVALAGLAVLALRRRRQVAKG